MSNSIEILENTLNPINLEISNDAIDETEEQKISVDININEDNNEIEEEQNSVYNTNIIIEDNYGYIKVKFVLFEFLYFIQNFLILLYCILF